MPIFDKETEKEIAKVTKNPSSILEISQPNDEVKLAAIKADPWVLVDFLKHRIPFTDMMLETAISMEGNLIYYICNAQEKFGWPSEKIQLAAVKQDGDTLYYLTSKSLNSNNYPISQAVQMIAVNNKPATIGLLPNASRIVQLTAVKANPDVYYLIKNPDPLVTEYIQKQRHQIFEISTTPTDAQLIRQVRYDPSSIRNIRKPNESVQLAAVKKDGLILKTIFDMGIKPSDDVQICAIEQNSKAIVYIKNPSVTVQKEFARMYPHDKASIQNPTKEIIFAGLKGRSESASEWIKLLKDPTEEDLINAVKICAYAIKWLDNPSEKVQLAAVRKVGYSIKYIKHPTELVQITAITNKDGRESGGSILSYINDLCENAKLAAVNLDGNFIKFIKNPSDEMKLLAIRQSGYSIRYINNPSESLKMEAVSHNGGVIQYIKNPSREIQLAAVENDGHAIYYIKNPTHEVKLAAVKKTGTAINYIRSPNEEIQLAAVQQNPHAINYIFSKNIILSNKVLETAIRKQPRVLEMIPNPSEDLKLLAVSIDGIAITCIRNPSEKIIDTAIKQNGAAIRYISSPTESQIICAVSQNGLIFKWLKDHHFDITRSIELAAVSKLPSNISYIDNPSRIIQLTAVKGTKTLTELKDIYHRILIPDPFVTEYCNIAIAKNSEIVAKAKKTKAINQATKQTVKKRR